MLKDKIEESFLSEDALVDRSACRTHTRCARSGLGTPISVLDTPAVCPARHGAVRAALKPRGFAAAQGHLQGLAVPQEQGAAAARPRALGAAPPRPAPPRLNRAGFCF
jgi:hypothetical protein